MFFAIPFINLVTIFFNTVQFSPKFFMIQQNIFHEDAINRLVIIVSLLNLFKDFLCLQKDVLAWEKIVV